MLWIVDGLIYGFLTAVYTMFNQHYKLDGYLLGLWRGWGISFIFIPFLFIFGLPDSSYHWLLLILQGILIAIYDSRLFFASAKYGAGATSRVMALTALFTTMLWWILTPQRFNSMLNNTALVIIILLLLIGFSICYWLMIKSPVSKELVKYMFPAILSLSGMSIVTKEIALFRPDVWNGVVYYLAISTFVSGCLNARWYKTNQKIKYGTLFKQIFSPIAVKIGLYVILFSTPLITAKNLALRSAPNPGYVIALLLTAPLFVFAINKYKKVVDNLSVKEGFLMLFFLSALMIVVAGNFGVSD